MTHIADPQVSMRLVRTAQAVDPSIVIAQRSFLQAIKLCVQLGGFENEKAVAAHLGIDPGHWSRIMTEHAHFPTDKLCELMDMCGNEAPLLWLVNSRGYDVHTLRRLESENERTIRELKEALDEERKRSEILTQAIRGVGR